MGFLGHLQIITKLIQPFYYIKFDNKLTPINFSIIDNFEKKTKITAWYCLDENKKTHKFVLTKNNIFNLIIICYKIVGKYIVIVKYSYNYLFLLLAYLNINIKIYNIINNTARFKILKIL